MKESKTCRKRLFNIFDINKNAKIESSEIRTIMKAIGLFPTQETIRNIIAEVDTNGDGVVDFDEFCEMRQKEQSCELNIIAEFKKFDVSRMHKGFIDVNCVKEVLSRDGYSEADIETSARHFMMADLNKNGKVSFGELYSRMMERVPEEWLRWTYVNVKRGVSDEQILNILEENGFSAAVSSKLLTETKKSGKQSVTQNYADHSRACLYHMRA